MAGSMRAACWRSPSALPARAIIADFAAIAAEAKSPLNAVLLGAIAASGGLPIPAETFRDAIRAEGKAVEANLRGFEAGLAVAARGRGAVRATPLARASAPPTSP